MRADDFLFCFGIINNNKLIGAYWRLEVSEGLWNFEGWEKESIGWGTWSLLDPWEMLDVLRTMSIICLGRYRTFCTEFQQDESGALTQCQGTPMPPCGTHRLHIQESRPASNWIWFVLEKTIMVSLLSIRTYTFECEHKLYVCIMYADMYVEARHGHWVFSTGSHRAHCLCRLDD